MVIGPPEIMAAFDPRVPRESLPKKTWVVLSRIPTAVGVAGTGLLGVNWIIRRRMALAQENGTSLEEPRRPAPEDNGKGGES